jgi:mRNA-degrading endonuclease RelE of RelBE toxin-antitoxin system
LPYEVLLDPRVEKTLKKLDSQNKARVKRALTELSIDPYKAGEPIHPSQFWKLKEGDYRAIYTIKPEKKQAVVLFLGHRKNVYDDFSKLI